MIQSFLQYIRYEKNYSSHTVLSYQTDIEQLRDFIITQKGGFDPKNLTSDELREWVIALMDVGEKPSSVKRKLSAVRSFYKFLNLKNLTDNNPTLKIVAPKVPKSLPKFFYEKDLDNCLEVSEKNCNFEGARNSLIIELIYQTGLRRSEVANLEDVNVDVINRQLKVLGKGNKERVVPFGRGLAEMIETYRAKRDGEVDVNTTKFFVHQKGTALNPMHIYNVVRKLMGAVTTQEKRSPHVLRHTFATSLLNDGADVKAIKDLLGHETLAATQVYTHASFEQIKKSYQQAHPRGEKEKEDTMEVRIQSIHFDATEKLQQFIEKKVNKLERISDELSTAEVILKVVKPETSENKEAKITVLAPNTEFFASKVCDTFEEAIDLCVEALEKQIKKAKEKK